MNTSSTRSRFVRLAAATLTALSLGAIACPALAVVDAPTGGWQVTLYENAGCEGGVSYYQGDVPESGSQTNQVSTLGSFNDTASSWSICNNSGWTLYFSFHMYTDANFSGTELSPLTNGVALPTGVCFTGNHITPNDAVSSYRITVSTS